MSKYWRENKEKDKKIIPRQVFKNSGLNVNIKSQSNVLFPDPSENERLVRQAQEMIMNDSSGGFLKSDTPSGEQVAKPGVTPGDTPGDTPSGGMFSGLFKYLGY
jgi:hypothetical protein